MVYRRNCQKNMVIFIYWLGYVIFLSNTLLRIIWFSQVADVEYFLLVGEVSQWVRALWTFCETFVSGSRLGTWGAMAFFVQLPCRDVASPVACVNRAWFVLNDCVRNRSSAKRDGASFASVSVGPLMIRAGKLWPWDSSESRTLHELFI